MRFEFGVFGRNQEGDIELQACASYGLHNVCPNSNMSDEPYEHIYS